MLKYNQIKISYVVQIYNEQKKSDDFYKLLDTYNNLPKNILKHIHFIFIDDCSPIKISIPNTYTLNYTIAKVTTDIKWNQGGARNLGVHLSKSQKLIVTDLDHLFTEESFKFLFNFPIPNDIFVFRRMINKKEVVSHYNTFFISKSTYFKSLGIDEEFCGNYGHEDVFFLDMQKRLGTKLYKFKDHPIQFSEHKESKNPQHHLIRNEENTRPLYNAKKNILLDKNRDPFEAHSRLFLNFDWKIIEEKFDL